MKFFVPGKTFLVGEYAVLLGGASLGLATKPYFEFDYLQDVADADLDLKRLKTEKSFHPDSPAGMLVKKHNLKLKFYFKNHYLEQGVLGGFGASTAEYLIALTPLLLNCKKSFFDILNEYKDLHVAQNVKPSGNDLAFQYFGQVTLADSALNFYQNFDWIFTNLDFCVISTGQKVPTHQHLADLDLTRLQDLPALSHQITKVYAENKPDDFIGLMREWCDKLEEKNLTHLHSLHLRKQLEKNENILLVKPCGALGADVMLVFFKRRDGEAVLQYLNEQKIQVMAGSDELSHGFVSQIRNLGSDYVVRSLSPV